MEGSPEDFPIVMPHLEVETHTGEFITLSWANTVLLTYREAVYNHIEWLAPDGNTYGFVTPQEIMDDLFDAEFPYVFSPVISDETKQWYEAMATGDLEDELKQLTKGEL